MTYSILYCHRVKLLATVRVNYYFLFSSDERKIYNIIALTRAWHVFREIQNYSVACPSRRLMGFILGVPWFISNGNRIKYLTTRSRATCTSISSVSNKVIPFVNYLATANRVKIFTFRSVSGSAAPPERISSRQPDADAAACTQSRRKVPIKLPVVSAWIIYKNTSLYGPRTTNWFATAAWNTSPVVQCVRAGYVIKYKK